MTEAEPLRTGWEPDRPPGDTILGDYVASWARWLEGIARSCDDRWERHDDVALGDAGSPSMFRNTGLVLQPITGNGDAFVERLCSFYDGGPGGRYVIFSPWPTPDLAPAGFELAGHPPMMLRPAGGGAPTSPRDLRIEEVTDDTLRKAFDRALIDGFPIADAAGKEFIDAGWLDVAGWRMWVGFVGSEPVATAGAHTDDRAQHVELVSTRAEFRGRGFGEAITWRATLSDPEKPALLVASDDGRPIYERMGYLAVTRFTLWIGTRS